MFPRPSIPELLIIGFLAIVFFGKDKLPETAGSLGKAFKSFKKELADTQESLGSNTEKTINKDKN